VSAGADAALLLCPTTNGPAVADGGREEHYFSQTDTRRAESPSERSSRSWVHHVGIYLQQLETVPVRCQFENRIKGIDNRP
jgi:hypothetical protein